MAIDHYGSVNGPFYPFGAITVATPGTPVPLSQNFTTQQQAYLPTGNSEYALNFNQLYVYAPTSNTGNIYLVAQGGSKTITNSILFILPPGQFFFFGTAAPNRNVFGVLDIWVDADTASNTCQATGIKG
jgi:hypothetical protein